MARTDTLGNFLTDVAEAIRTKEGTTETITASEFDTRISNLSGGSEDLSEELNTYGIELETQNTSLDSIIIALQGKGSSGSGALNVFVQETQPETLNGIWVQRETSTADIIEITTEAELNLSWGTDVTLPSADREIGVAVIGTDIYLVGGASGGSTLYKFDTTTNTFTQLSDLPYSGYGIAVAAHGTDLYMFGGCWSSTVYTNAYKYDTLTDTFTQLTSIPYKTGQTGIAINGTDIYLIGGYSGSTQLSNTYKYDILTDTYTQLANLPSKRNAAAAVLHNNSIYVLGGFNGKSMGDMLRYDIDTNTYTQLSDLPYIGFGIAASLYHNYIVFAGGENSDSVYSYDVYKDKYTQLPSLSAERTRTTGAIVGDKFYVAGGSVGTSSNFSTMPVGSLESTLANYSNSLNTLIVGVAPIGTNRIALGSANGIVYTNIADIYYYSTSSGVDYDAPVYIGDGETWNAL